jgi:hypothetical protein
VRQAAALTACEQRLQPDRRPGVPTVAIVGASFTAGVGAEDPAGSWAVLLARQLHWNAFVYGVPGAGYVHPGLGRKGPVAAAAGSCCGAASAAAPEPSAVPEPVSAGAGVPAEAASPVIPSVRAALAGTTTDQNGT